MFIRKIPVNSPWFGRAEPGPDAAHRLFCLPYAGGSAAAYRDWQALAPGDLQVCPLELPGHGRRITESSPSRMRPLADAIAGALAPHVERPYALFGHSMGGLLAFEVARTLRRWELALPAHLFVSGAADPALPPAGSAVHTASDADVVEALRRLGSTPAVLLDNAEVMATLLPTIRADFAVVETYEYRDEPPLPVPLTVLGGADDRLAPAERLEGWRRQSTEGARLHVLDGGHFFLHSGSSGVMKIIADALAPADTHSSR